MFTVDARFPKHHAEAFTAQDWVHNLLDHVAGFKSLCPCLVGHAAQVHVNSRLNQ
jgi:hypothetical protein